MIRRHLGPVRRFLAVFAVACAAVLLLAAGSPPLQAQARTAPEDEQAFHRLVVGQRFAALESDPFSYTDFVAAGRFKSTDGLETFTGSYSYSNTGVNTGDLVLNPDDGDRCTARVTFSSETTGSASSTCDDGSSFEYNWRLVEIPSG